MNSNIDIVKRLNKACEARDFETAKSLLHSNYKLRMPGMQANSADEFLEQMQNCPGDAKMENITFIMDEKDTGKVVQIFDMKATDPVPYSTRVCDVLTIENGKVRSEEVFFDSAEIPQEAKDMMEKAMKDSKKKAA
jgi:ketosteroid isomerase-like protein